MLPLLRQQKILALLKQHGVVSVGRLARSVRASEMTVRRDLTVLRDGGLVRRLHGGAALEIGKAEESPFSSARQEHVEEKEVIAKEAATLVSPGSVVALGAGTTTWHVAKALAARTDLTFITNSTNIALELDRGQSNIILSGGRSQQVRPRGPGFVCADRSGARTYHQLCRASVHVASHPAPRCPGGGGGQGRTMRGEKGAGGGRASMLPALGVAAIIHAYPPPLQLRATGRFFLDSGANPGSSFRDWGEPGGRVRRASRVVRPDAPESIFVSPILFPQTSNRATFRVCVRCEL